jgi:hypothetical protein
MIAKIVKGAAVAVALTALGVCGLPNAQERTPNRNPTGSLAMWAHYGAQAKGYVVRFGVVPRDSSKAGSARSFSA